MRLFISEATRKLLIFFKREDFVGVQLVCYPFFFPNGLCDLFWKFQEFFFFSVLVVWGGLWGVDAQNLIKSISLALFTSLGTVVNVFAPWAS